MSAVAESHDRQIFEAIAKKISSITGVQLGEKQYSLVLSRLSKHLRNMGGLCAAEYWEYLQNHEEDEIPVLISLLTTHHTFFFREQVHFDHLNSILPQFIAQIKEQKKTSINIWCAACSRGQEGYTIAMFLDYHLRQLGASLDYKILFSDVDGASVHWAKNGVYSNEELSRVPINYRSNHWTRGQGNISNFSKVKNSLKDHCEFKTINLLTLNKETFLQKFDIIFCRNVFIYFSIQEIESISRNILKNMEPYGLFLIGVSESLLGAKLPVKHLGKSIYTKSSVESVVNSVNDTKKESEEANVSRKKSTDLRQTHHRKQSSIHKKPHRLELAKNVDKGTKTSYIKKSNPIQETIKVITLQSSIKISPNIRTVINQIPGFKSVGFDVVRSASEAVDRIRKKEADLLILECDAYIHLNKIKSHVNIPTILVASSRQDEGKLAKAMESGATDYLKSDFATISDREKQVLEAKLNQAIKSTKNNPNDDLKGLNTVFANNFDPSYIIAIGASTGGTEAIMKVLIKLPANIPPIVIVQHIPEFYSRSFAERLHNLCEINVKEAENGDTLESGLALIAPGNFHMEVVKSGSQYKVKVYDGEKVNGHRPSVDVLFHSLAALKGPRVGVLLTGMGADGAKGLLKLSENGAYTITQDEKSCVVYGMPKSAEQLGASKKVLAIENIADEVISVTEKKPNKLK